MWAYTHSVAQAQMELTENFKNFKREWEKTSESRPHRQRIMYGIKIETCRQDLCQEIGKNFREFSLGSRDIKEAMKKNYFSLVFRSMIIENSEMKWAPAPHAEQ